MAKRRLLRKTRKTNGISRAAKLALIAAALGFLGERVGNVATAQKKSSGTEQGLEVVEKGDETCAALLVGVNHYNNNSLGALKYACDDVGKVRDALIQIGFPAKNIRELVGDGPVGDRPTRAAILAALDDLLAKSGPKSSVWIVFSGHGFDTSDNRSAFCPEDAEVKWSADGVPTAKAESVILLEDVVKRLRQDDARFKLLIVDACRQPATLARSATAKPRPFSKVDASGLAFLQSCDSEEFSWEHPESNGGVFIDFFTKGLRGEGNANPDGGITFLELCGSVSKETISFTDKKCASVQTPYYTLSGVSDFYLTEPRPGRDADNPFWLPLGGLALLAVLAGWAFGKKIREFGAGIFGDQAGDLKELKINGVNYAFRYCPPGEFLMGSASDEIGREDDEAPRHRVTLTRGYWLLEIPVTQKMWTSVMEGNNPSAFSVVDGVDTSSFPVENVSWTDCQKFIERLNAARVATFRLPTEAEWEYACRAGSETPFFWGDALDITKANYYQSDCSPNNALQRTAGPENYQANAWGFVHMHGNVCEWCQDYYDENYYQKANNAKNPVNKTSTGEQKRRVLRGGHWGNLAQYCRSAYRSYDEEGSRDCYTGFRLAMDWNPFRLRFKFVLRFFPSRRRSRRF